jgi:RNA polymerase primary sigma factor
MKHQLKAISFGKSNTTCVERTSELAAYLAAINNFPQLTIDQEVELGWRIKAGDADAVNELVNANLRAVVSIAKQYAYCGGCLTITDLINEGNLGLIYAAQTFDTTYGNKFMSYAVGHIRRYILEALKNKSRIVADYHRDAPNGHSSLDAPTSDDNTTTMGDNLPSIDNDNMATTESLANDIIRVLNSLLKPAEINVICIIYGIGTQQKNRWEIAEDLNKTEERIRQIEQHALYKIRNNQQALMLLTKYRA